MMGNKKILAVIIFFAAMSLFLTGCVKKPEALPCCLRDAAANNVCDLGNGTEYYKIDGVRTAYPLTKLCNFTSGFCEIWMDEKGRGVEFYPICTEREFDFCEMENCTTMVCGKFDFEPARVVSASATTANKENLKDEATKGGEARQGLYEGGCGFVPYDRRINDIFKSSKGAYVNTFRLGLNSGYAGFSKLRYLFPISDYFCNVNPYGSIDRYVNYLVPPAGVDTGALYTEFDPVKEFSGVSALEPPYQKPFQTAEYGGGSGTYLFWTYLANPDTDLEYTDLGLNKALYSKALAYIYWGRMYWDGRTPFECESRVECYSSSCNTETYSREVCDKKDGTKADCQCRMAFDQDIDDYVVRCKPVGRSGIHIYSPPAPKSGFMKPSKDFFENFDKYYFYTYDTVFAKKLLQVSLCENYFEKGRVNSYCKLYDVDVHPDGAEDGEYDFYMDETSTDSFARNYQKNFKIGFSGGYQQASTGTGSVYCSWAPYESAKDEFDEWIPNGFDPTIVFPGINKMPPIPGNVKGTLQNKQPIGYSILTPESFDRSALATECKLKKGTDYYVFNTRDFVPNLNETLGNTWAVQPWIADTSHPHCYLQKTPFGVFPKYGDTVQVGISSEYIILITGLGDCGGASQAFSVFKTDGPRVKTLGWCEPCSYATMVGHRVITSDDENYLQGKTKEYLQQEVIPVLDLSNFESDLDGSPAISTLKADPGPVIVILGTLSTYSEASSSAKAATLRGNIQKVRSYCPKCLVSLKVNDANTYSSLEEDQKLLGEFFGLPADYESCLEAAQDGKPCRGQDILNNLDLISFEYYPNGVDAFYFCIDEGYYSNNFQSAGKVKYDVFVNRLADFGHQTLRKFNLPTLVSNFGLVEHDICAALSQIYKNIPFIPKSYEAKAYEGTIKNLILKQSALTENGVIGVLVSAALPSAGSPTATMDVAVLRPVEKGAKIISAGKPTTVFVRTEVLPAQDAKCSMCTAIDVALKKCGDLTCANGQKCTPLPDPSGAKPEENQLCQDNVIPAPCKLCNDTAYKGKRVSCEVTYANGTTSQLGPLMFDELNDLYVDVISSLSDSKCCLQDSGGNIYTYYKREAITSTLSPILFSKVGNENVSCNFLGSDNLGKFCGSDLSVKNYKLKCEVK